MNANAVSRSLKENEAYLRQRFHPSSDIVFRAFALQDRTPLLLVYLDGMASVESIEGNVLKPLLFGGLPEGIDRMRTLAETFRREWVPLANVLTDESLESLVKHILQGNMAILADGEASALVAQVQGYEKRSIQEPLKESTLRGSKEGFVENIRTNQSLIRRRILHADLKMESFTIGEYTRTEVMLVYMQGKADEKVLASVREKLKGIELEGVIDSSYIEEWIENNSFSLFSQIQNTERPDIVTASLLQERSPSSRAERRSRSSFPFLSGPGCSPRTTTSRDSRS